MILPVYNGAGYLDEAIQSVINQNFINWELMIIDDGSTDNSFEIAGAYSAKDERIQLLQHENKENRGVSASRNLGVERSKGQWIAFLDADDYWYENKLEEVHQVILKHDKLAIIYSSADVLETAFSGTVKKDKYKSGFPGLLKNPFLKTLGGLSSATPSVVMRKDVFEKAGGFNENFTFSEDTLLFHSALLYGDLYFIDQPLLNVRYHDSSTKSIAKREVMINARLHVYLELFKYKEAEMYKEAISYRAATTGMEKAWRSFYKNPYKHGPVLFSALKKLWKSKDVFLKHKAGALFLPIKILIHRSPSL